MPAKLRDVLLRTARAAAPTTAALGGCRGGANAAWAPGGGIQDEFGTGSRFSGILRQHARTRLYVFPILWTDHHSRALDVRFNRRSVIDGPVPESPARLEQSRNAQTLALGLDTLLSPRGTSAQASQTIGCVMSIFVCYAPVHKSSGRFNAAGSACRDVRCTRQPGEMGPLGFGRGRGRRWGQCWDDDRQVNSECARSCSLLHLLGTSTAFLNSKLESACGPVERSCACNAMEWDMSGEYRRKH